MTGQIPLFRAATSPDVSEADVLVLVYQLHGAGWVTARHLLARLQRLRPEWTDRTLRAIAAGSKGRIIGGQRGYCLIEHASVEDANHAAARLQHQGELMIARANEIRRAMHKRTAAA